MVRIQQSLPIVTASPAAVVLTTRALACMDSHGRTITATTIKTITKKAIA
jgi:hypothetical protein